MFEHQESRADCLQLLCGPSAQSDARREVSQHYAALLARLARARGLDGYLLNFEYGLGTAGHSGHDQARMLRAWISLLQDQLSAYVGHHAQVIW